MSATLGLFEGFGIEIEYMIVDAASLDVLPVTDRAIRAVAGEYVNEVERGPLAWSNELALHVIELKTNGPAPSLAPLPRVFRAGVDEVNAVLTGMGARLMPGPMHPWMDPHTETRLWPHDYNPIYEAYNRIFDCRGHGWSNLQSMHVNLPFAGEDEFVRLHAAIRAALPILPMLAAGSPYCDGRASGALDHRMQVYRGNAARIPSIAGHVVPEAVTGIDAYHELILAPMYADIAPHDPDGILQEEWLNSRGAIARFDRNAIEIRVLDSGVSARRHRRGRRRGRSRARPRLRAPRQAGSTAGDGHHRAGADLLRRGRARRTRRDREPRLPRRPRRRALARHRRCVVGAPHRARAARRRGAGRTPRAHPRPWHAGQPPRGLRRPGTRPDAARRLLPATRRVPRRRRTIHRVDGARSQRGGSTTPPMLPLTRNQPVRL
ncbi:MAG: glutamate-cysteine ligase family protein [Gammaproteobacteria bacterium]|nr:glutamate-cysteine ligase family protein [Gammaproteobacteria bacterium]